jgi:hypothetical protein
MIDALVAAILDEGKWLTTSIAIALLSIAILHLRHRRSELPARRRIAAAMNLFFGVTIGTMAFGHLLAVTTKLVLRNLEGSVPLFYLIGIVLAIPSGWLILHVLRSRGSGCDHDRKTVVINAWLAITLLALGIHNLPLAIPGLLNIGYQLHSRRAVGWVLVGTAVVVNLGLFVGSLIFLASGQSFEQFSGME